MYSVFLSDLNDPARLFARRIVPESEHHIRRPFKEANISFPAHPALTMLQTNELLFHLSSAARADLKFDMISGTNGLAGAADGAFLLQKEKRTDGNAVLDVAGRDQQDQRFYLTKDKERLIWTLERTETEAWTEPPDPVLEAVAALVTAESPSWAGTATELAAALQTDMKPNALAMRLNVRAGKLLTDYHIRYENSRSHAGRSISLTLEPPQA